MSLYTPTANRQPGLRLSAAVSSPFRSINQFSVDCLSTQLITPSALSSRAPSALSRLPPPPQNRPTRSSHGGLQRRTQVWAWRFLCPSKNEVSFLQLWSHRVSGGCIHWGHCQYPEPGPGQPGRHLFPTQESQCGLPHVTPNPPAPRRRRCFRLNGKRSPLGSRPTRSGRSEL